MTVGETLTATLPGQWYVHGGLGSTGGSTRTAAAQRRNTYTVLSRGALGRWRMTVNCRERLCESPYYGVTVRRSVSGQCADVNEKT
ncbi:hypothetical protein FRX31_008020 [Thalictrum thalictroides]|uniref:Uncharacterized protein n=1 Tax=Thalictrum thalictroides TaxID=46969 RepID=A0A7J6WZ95_THATH|nr:hypothetical protein FRX31_008020 [Thalictrum thalictroides]